MIEGLRAASGIDPAADVLVRMDSKLVVEQMSGRWKIKHDDMRRLALQARDLVAEISSAGGSVSFEWMPREQNKTADALSNRGMDGVTISRRLDLEEARDTSAAEAVDEVIDPAPSGTAAPVGLGPDIGTPTRILLVRHGVTDFTAEGRLDGRGGADPSLNAAGRSQAAAAGRATAHLLGEAQARLVTSSLTRAVETGAAVGRETGLMAEVDPDWDEQSFGDWDGEKVADLMRADPDALRALRNDPAYARPGGETHDEMAVRVLAAFERCVAAGGTTVVVCHRKPIMTVLAHLLQMPHETIWRLAAAPGSLTAIEVWEDGNASVAFTNRT